MFLYSYVCTLYICCWHSHLRHIKEKCFSIFSTNVSHFRHITWLSASVIVQLYELVQDKIQGPPTSVCHIFPYHRVNFTLPISDDNPPHPSFFLSSKVSIPFFALVFYSVSPLYCICPDLPYPYPTASLCPSILPLCSLCAFVPLFLCLLFPFLLVSFPSQSVPPRPPSPCPKSPSLPPPQKNVENSLKINLNNPIL